jgi:hypothetical protein
MTARISRFLGYVDGLTVSKLKNIQLLMGDGDERGG